jgi:hypothetical protein
LHKDVTIGDEHDKAAFKALKDVLAAEGAQEFDRWSGVGGSQEIHAWGHKIGDEVLVPQKPTSAYQSAARLSQYHASLRPLGSD